MINVSKFYLYLSSENPEKKEENHYLLIHMRNKTVKERKTAAQEKNEK